MVRRKFSMGQAAKNTGFAGPIPLGQRNEIPGNHFRFADMEWPAHLS